MRTLTYTTDRIELPTPFPVGPVNAYVVRTASTCVLVDCGPKYPPAREALVNGLRNLDLTPRDVQQLILTHGHADHVGLAGWLQDMGIPIAAHPLTQHWLNPGGPSEAYQLAFFQTLYAQLGVPEAHALRCLKELSLLSQWTDRSVVTVPVEEGQFIPQLPFQVIELPGHAQHAIGLWDAANGTLLAGDQILQRISSNALIEPELGAANGSVAKRTHSLVSYRSNLQRLAKLPIERVLPGHGAPFSDVGELIAERLQAQQKRRSEFCELVQRIDGASTFDLAIAYFPRHLNQLPLILSETLGYLDWLEETGEISSCTEENGVIRWHPVCSK